MDVSDSSGVGPAAAERKLVAVLACEVSALTTSRAERPWTSTTGRWLTPSVRLRLRSRAMAGQ